MTEETQASAAEQAKAAAPAPEQPAQNAAPTAEQPAQNTAPSAQEQAKAEAVAKAQEVGKKLSGFLGGLAEKAKSIDVKELTEKAKQKVNEVKDKASELNAGKTENAVPPRETMAADQIKQLLDEAAKATDEIPNIVLAILADVAQGEQIALKMKFGTPADQTYVAVSAKNIFHFVKSSDPFQVFVYPLSKIFGFSVLPPRGETAGRLTILLEKEEIKLTLTGIEAYARALILYKKLKSPSAEK